MIGIIPTREVQDTYRRALDKLQTAREDLDAAQRARNADLAAVAFEDLTQAWNTLDIIESYANDQTISLGHIRLWHAVTTKKF